MTVTAVGGGLKAGDFLGEVMTMGESTVPVRWVRAPRFVRLARGNGRSPDGLAATPVDTTWFLGGGDDGKDRHAAEPLQWKTCSTDWGR